jgi:nucleoid DNA-binding protein
MNTVEKNFDLQDLVHATEAAANYPVDQVDEILKAAFKIIRKEVTERGYVTLDKFGSFKIRELAAETGHTQTGAPYEAGKRITVDFNPFITFRDELSQFHGEPAIL